jgi:acetyl-CoA synthetase
MANPDFRRLSLSGMGFARYKKLCDDAKNDPPGFWSAAADELVWFKKWDRVVDKSDAPFYRWFAGGKCNIVSNAVDRHMGTPLEKKTAILWEGESGETRRLTYAELNDAVCRFAGVLKSLGVRKGDRVTTYMPNIPEQAIAMLACAKIGAVHSVVYAGFSAEALGKRIDDARPKVLVTANYTARKGEKVRLAGTVRAAVRGRKLKAISVCRGERAGKGFLSWEKLMAKAKPLERTARMNSTDPLFILYTSGTTGKPKGVVHTHGGYMVGVARTLRWVFDIRDDDVYWCTADPGWITGHSYVVYGPLMLGITTVMHETIPTYPNPDRWWKVIDKYKVNVFYTAPTAIRMLMRSGEAWPEKHAMKSLRVLGSVGEPINPDAWEWFHKNVGKSRCKIMDTWWQTETGSFLVTPAPPVRLKPGSVTLPFPGIVADVVDDKGKPVPDGTEGRLVIRNQWPSMFATLYMHRKRFIENYWSPVRGCYLSGDMAKRDSDGYFWIIGRSDDVIKISGHRLGSAEAEDALDEHRSVAESAVIGVPDELRGQVMKAFVILKKSAQPSDRLKQELAEQVRRKLGPIAVVKEVEFVDSLPKTRSGKIMRRVLRAKETGEKLGDLSTLES